MTCNQIVNSSGPVSEEDCEGAIDYQNGGAIPGATINSLSSVLIDSFSGWQPPLMEQLDSSCDYCSVEPEGLINPFDGINFLLGSALNIASIFDKPNVFVYLNYYRDLHGNITVPSLKIDNQSLLDFSIMFIGVSVTSFNQQTYNYKISQEDLIGPLNYRFGVRAGGNSNSVTKVNLTPSGDFLYPENRFRATDYVRIIISIADSHSGQYVPIDVYSFYSGQLGENK
jgi:hypothetical protein